MSRLDAFFGRIQSAGIDLALGFGLNFSSSLSAVRNPTTKYIDVSVASDSLDPTHLATPVSGFNVPVVLRAAFTAGGGGADDVEVLTDAPYGFRILDVAVLVSTADSGDTVQLRSESGGAGSALSSAISVGATGTARNSDTETRTVAAGGDVYLRRTSDVCAGEVVIWAVRT